MMSPYDIVLVLSNAARVQHSLFLRQELKATSQEPVGHGHTRTDKGKETKMISRRALRGRREGIFWSLREGTEVIENVEYRISKANPRSYRYSTIPFPTATSQQLSANRHRRFRSLRERARENREDAKDAKVGIFEQIVTADLFKSHLRKLAFTKPFPHDP